MKVKKKTILSQKNGFKKLIPDSTKVGIWCTSVHPMFVVVYCYVKHFVLLVVSRKFLSYRSRVFLLVIRENKVDRICEHF